MERKTLRRYKFREDVTEQMLFVLFYMGILRRPPERLKTILWRHLLMQNEDNELEDDFYFDRFLNHQYL
jgi:hypothetical protein